MGPSFSLWLNDRPGGARAAQALLHMAVSYSPGKGVRLMWRKKLSSVLAFIVTAILMLILLTAKAC